MCVRNVYTKKYKNRIYLRKKGDDKNRKKKDFFPPEKVSYEIAKKKIQIKSNMI